MMTHETIPSETSVPAYYATFGTQRIPFLVSLAFIDQHSRIQLVPALKRAIDRTVEVTGRQGLATTVVADTDILRDVARQRLTQMCVLPDMILLFLCQSSDTMDRLMAHLHAAFPLSLVRASPGGTDVSHMQPLAVGERPSH